MLPLSFGPDIAWKTFKGARSQSTAKDYLITIDQAQICLYIVAVIALCTGLRLLELASR